jgi:antirestriction protein ArdC
MAWHPSSAFDGQPYSGINVLSLWMPAFSQNFAAPIWMAYRQARELNAHVCKEEKGSLVVYANAITRNERDEKSGEDVEPRNPCRLPQSEIRLIRSSAARLRWRR